MKNLNDRQARNPIQDEFRDFEEYLAFGWRDARAEDDARITIRDTVRKDFCNQHITVTKTS